MPQRFFKKYVGCGNDFLLFDNRNQDFPSSSPSLIKKLCDRHFGIGADGILLLETSFKADVRMRIFNSDGLEAEMCGNGMRCFVAWLETLGCQQSHYTIETMHQVLTAKLEGSKVSIEMGSPRDMHWDREIEILDQTIVGHYLYMGVPHLIVFVDHLQAIDVAQWGKALREHEMWKPQGTNVNFVQILSKQKIKMRTFERGVEGETLACGTGATAAALATAYLEKIIEPICVETKSGEELIITFLKNNQTFSKVEMSGTASFVFSGELDLANFADNSFDKGIL